MRRARRTDLIDQLELLALLCLCCQAGPLRAQQPAPAVTPPPLQTFANVSDTFRIGLPPTWRQLAPNEARRLAGLDLGLPRNLARTEPGLFYPVGPVDAWLAGRFDGTYLYVVEQDNEWQLDDGFAVLLQEMWRAKGEEDRVRHELADVRRTELEGIGSNVVTCIRTSIPAEGRAQRSLDCYVPTGGRQISLAFTSWADEFEQREPAFRAWLATLRVARPARGEQTVADRMWGPLAGGTVVGLLLLFLYKRSRRVV